MTAQIVQVSGGVLAAATFNLLPWGAVAAPATATSNQTTITTVVDLAGLTLTFTAIANRRYRITGQGLFSSTVTGDNVTLTITDGSNTVIQTANLIVSSAGTQTISIAVVVQPSAGSATYKLRAARASGSGTITLTAGATAPAFISIDDVGST